MLGIIHRGPERKCGGWILMVSEQSIGEAGILAVSTSTNHITVFLWWRRYKQGCVDKRK